MTGLSQRSSGIWATTKHATVPRPPRPAWPTAAAAASTRAPSCPLAFDRGGRPTGGGNSTDSAGPFPALLALMRLYGRNMVRRFPPAPDAALSDPTLAFAVHSIRVDIIGSRFAHLARDAIVSAALLTRASKNPCTARRGAQADQRQRAGLRSAEQRSSTRPAGDPRTNRLTTASTNAVARIRGNGVLCEAPSSQQLAVGCDQVTQIWSR